MAKTLRYTGSWPPLAVLTDYPNWIFATDEESEPGQDETTIKPESQQSYISEETDFTSATITFASGVTGSAIVSLIQGQIDAIDVFDGRDWWRLTVDYDGRVWTPLVETWLPESQRREIRHQSLSVPAARQRRAWRCAASAADSAAAC